MDWKFEECDQYDEAMVFGLVVCPAPLFFVVVLIGCLQGVVTKYNTGTYVISEKTAIENWVAGCCPIKSLHRYYFVTVYPLDEQNSHDTVQKMEVLGCWWFVQTWGECIVVRYHDNEMMSDKRFWLWWFDWKMCSLTKWSSFLTFLSAVHELIITLQCHLKGLLEMIHHNWGFTNIWNRIISTALIHCWIIRFILVIGPCFKSFILQTWKNKANKTTKRTKNHGHCISTTQLNK